MNQPIEFSSLPQLAPPGAGVPPPELVAARLFFNWSRLTSTRARVTALFQRERNRVRQLAGRCTKESGACRVLIRRIPGMEDSSRFWSVWMTLDHLHIVQNGLARTIGNLGTGVAMEGVASTAAVKPHMDADERALQKFEQSCELVLDQAARIQDLNTPTRYAHPWFGPLNAHGWYVMAPFHLKLHRVQIERILESTSLESTPSATR